jgi:hypothetical protein
LYSGLVCLLCITHPIIIVRLFVHDRHSQHIQTKAQLKPHKDSIIYHLAMLFTKLTSSIAALAALAAIVTASPVQSRQTENFHLKTTGGSIPSHNDLYVEAYHTGAGFNDAVLTSDISTAAPFFLNGTYAQFDLNTDFPWGFSMEAASNYACEFPAYPSISAAL